MANLSPWRTGLLGFLALTALATLAGLFILRPTSALTEHTSPDFSTTYALNHPQVEGTVDNHLCSDPHTGRAFDEAPLIPAEGDETSCTRALIDLNSGADAGRKTQLVFYGVASDPTLNQGDEIILTVSSDGTYAFADFQRSGNLALWAIIAALVIVGFAAWHGLRALVGLVNQLGNRLLLPHSFTHRRPFGAAAGARDLRGHPFLAVPLVHGVNWKSASALGGASDFGGVDKQHGTDGFQLGG